MKKFDDPLQNNLGTLSQIIGLKTQLRYHEHELLLSVQTR